MSYQAQTVNQLLTTVDNVVDDIFKDRIGAHALSLALNDLYPEIMYYHRSMLVYTETIKWFIATGQKLKGKYYPSEVKWDDESAQQFIDEIKTYLSKYNLSKKKFALQEDRNTKTLNKYLDDLTGHYGRLLFVRVDLHYRMDGIGENSIGNFHKHMKVLLKRIEKKDGCFKDWLGYAWALEQGYENDCCLHCHLLLMYDASKHHRGSYFGQAIGEKWMSIIEGQGYYFNANDPKHVKRFKRLGKRGVGMIHRNNDHEVQNAIRTSIYLTTKEDKYKQRLKVRLPRMRTFGHGEYEVSWRRGIER